MTLQGSSMSDSRYDLIIIGGGLVGLTAAIGAAQQGLSVAVIDRLSMDDTVDTGFDGRASALAFATVRMLETLGIWTHMEPEAQPILEIRVSDGPMGKPSPFFLHYDHADLQDGPLGYMVENRHTRLALMARLSHMDGIDVLAPAEVTDIERDSHEARVTLVGGRLLTAPLIVAADGKQSRTRDSAGISTTQWGYDQHGIVCAISFEETHAGIAHERFLPSGPFAILPLTGNRASLVWTEKSHLVPTIMNLSDRAFADEVKRRVGTFLGDVEVAGGRWSWPLSLQFAERYTDHRLALIGDAAHSIHPIAGQGLNLGLRDVAALLEVLTETARVGLDTGLAANLQAYAQWRTTDNAALMVVTDSLNRLFSNDIAPIAHVRDLGLALVDKMPPMKKFLMHHARGTVGTLPKLLRGEAL